MIVGSLMYVVGLALMATAQGMIPILIGAGVLIGISLACTANAIAMSVSARAVPATVRSYRDGHGLRGGIARRIGVGAARADVE